MFRVHSSFNKWAQKLLDSRNDEGLESPFKTAFDLYYLCFVVGVGKGRTLDTSSQDMRDLVKTFTESFQEYKYSIAGLLLVSELVNSHVGLNKDLVQSSVVNLLSSDTLLSSTAVDLMNSYALAGYNIIREELQSSPSQSYEFLIWFYNEMLPKCFNTSNWT